MKHPSVFTGVLCATLVLAPLVSRAQAPRPSTDATEEGRTHFNRAVAMFHEGDYRGALVEFRRAYEISHNYRTLYNIGQTEFEIQDYAGALDALQKYLAAGGAEIDADRRAAVEADVKQLNARVAKIEIRANMAGADVLVDDIVVGRTPLSAPLVVSAGRRKITLQKGDLVPSSRVIDIAGGDSSTITLNLSVPVPLAPPAVKASATREKRAPTPTPTGFWVSLGVTGALAVGTAVVGILAVRAHSDAEAKLGTLGVSASDIEASHTKTANLASVADIAGGATIGMALVTIITGITRGRSAPGGPPPAVALSVGPRGALVTGHF